MIRESSVADADFNADQCEYTAYLPLCELGRTPSIMQ